MALAAALAALSFVVAPAGATVRAELRETWTAYKKVYVSEDGRVIDYRAASATTSEGQSYALVRAVWMDDAATFERVRRWTVANLQGGDAEQLPAWKWGQGEDGTWGVRDPQPASDADQLYAWALLSAAKRWKKPEYTTLAYHLLVQLWAQEVDEVAGRMVVLPGPWARGQQPTRLNPSYFLPFAWRDFARADLSHPWGRLVDDGYALLTACRSPGGLARDWCYLDASGAVVPAAEPAHDAFAFEALRVPWTLAAEVRWHHERRARVLLRPYEALLSRTKAPSLLPGIILPDGRGAVDWEYQGMVGALLPVWALHHPCVTRRLYADRLATTRGDHGWGDPNDYYGQNWIWFGLALWKLEEMSA